MLIAIKNLIFILIIACLVFFIAKRAAGSIVTGNEMKNWRNTWIGVQSLAFLSPNIWFFFLLLLLACVFFIPKSPTNRLAYYALLLSSLPFLKATIPGFGLIDHFFTLSFPRALSLFLLLPTYLSTMRNSPKELRFFSFPADKFIFAFILVTALLDFRNNTFTNVLRISFLSWVDFFIPYYVVSRNMSTREQFNKVLLALLLSFSISALIGIFETIKSWHIYSDLVAQLLGWRGLSSYDIRAGHLRASATFMSPIVLGYVLTIALGLNFYLSPFVKSRILRHIIFAGLILGLLATVSRGPWVGFAFLCLVYIWTGKQKVKRLALLGLGGIFSLPLLLMTSFGQKFIDLLPFIGSNRADTVNYRDRLFDMSLIVIKRNPLFGSTNFLETPEMMSLIQGQGIIDIVNSYLRMTLEYGLTGLVLFIAILVTLLFQTYLSFKRLPKEEEDLIRLGRCLFSILCAISLIIYTVSSIDYIPYYYRMFFGIASAYAYCTRRVTLSFNS
jgi:O-antigen ligase